MISLVRLTTDDAPILADIGSASLIESHGHSATPDVMQQYVDKAFSEAACRAELEDDKNLFYGIFYNGQLAGYSKIILQVPHPAVSLRPGTKMERLYLLKEFYALKLGQQLMNEAISLSKAAGEKGMWLNVWKENDRAIRFYTKNGFEIVGESEFVLTATHSNPNWVMLLLYE